MRRWPLIASAIVALGALSGAAAYQHAAPRQDEQKQGERNGAWQEIAWPFPRDGWPAGKAFRCGAAACGGELEIYCGRRSVSAIATVASPTTMRSIASPISIC